MDKISELKGILGQYFSWNKARLDCFTRMILALITVQTVNLKQVAIAVVSNADIESRYKRLKRFFSKFELNYDFIARFIFSLFFVTTYPPQSILPDPSPKNRPRFLGKSDCFGDRIDRPHGSEHIHLVSNYLTSYAVEMYCNPDATDFYAFIVAFN